MDLKAQAIPDSCRQVLMIKFDISYSKNFVSKLGQRHYTNIDELLDALNSQDKITISITEQKYSDFKKKVVNKFVINCDELDTHLAFEIDTKKQSLRFFDLYDVPNKIIKRLEFEEDIEFTKNYYSMEERQTGINAIYANITDNIAQGDDLKITDDQFEQFWNHLIDFEEKILRADMAKNKAFLVTEVINNNPQNFIITLNSKLSENELSKNEYILNSKKGYSFAINLKHLKADEYKVSCKKKYYSAILADSVIEEDFTGRIVELSRKKQALDRLIKGQAVNKNLKKILVHPSLLNTSNKINSLVKCFNSHLSDSSKSVIGKAMAADDLYMIQGPPGTGKTTTISEIVYQSLVSNKKVLIASQANLAVDNVLEKIDALPQNYKNKVTRLGNKDKVEKEYALKYHSEHRVSIGKSTIISQTRKLIKKANDYNKRAITIEDIQILKDYLNTQEEINTEWHDLQVFNDLFSKYKEEYRTHQKDVKEIKYKAPGIEELNLNTNELEFVYFLHRSKIKLEQISKYDEMIKKHVSIKNDITQNDVKRKSALDAIAQLRQKTEKKEYYEKKLRELPNAGFFGSIGNMLQGHNEEKLKKELETIKKYETHIIINNKKLNEFNTIDKELNEKISKLESSISIIFKDYNLHDLNYCTENMELVKKYIDKSFSYSPLLESLPIEEIKLLHSIYLYRISKLIQTSEELKYTYRKYKEIKRKYFKLMKSNKELQITADEIKSKFDLKQINQDVINELEKELNGNKINKLIAKNKKYYENVLNNTVSDDSSLDVMINDFYKQQNQIVVTTCSNCASKEFQRYHNEYDYVIIDECSKALPTELFIPMINGKTIILVGDHKQLPPFVSTDLDKHFTDTDREILKETMFEHMYKQIGELSKTMLKTQYRMHIKIAQFISFLFYNNDLETAQERIEQDTQIFDLPLCFMHIEEGQQRLGTSFINKQEAQNIHILIDEIHKDVIRAKKNIGVISMYKSQSDYLKQLLFDYENVEVGTVDSFQGKEKDIIILSTVRTDKKLGFMQDKKRVNVALSRVKDHLFIFGNEMTLRKSEYFDYILNHIKNNSEAA